MLDSCDLIGYCAFKDLLPLRECRKKSLLPDNPKSVIVRLFPYYAGDMPQRNVARYACADDYHRVCGEMLRSFSLRLADEYPNAEFVSFIDDSPIPEVRAAHLAGLGTIGAHGMLIHEKYGSRVFIGTVATTLELEPSAPPREKSCSGCGRCVSACPTGALKSGEPLDRELCLSRISQKKGDLTAWEASRMQSGGFVWGCDICTDACPLNREAPLTPIAELRENLVPVLTRENLDAALPDKPYSWRGKDVLLRNIAIMEDAAGLV